MTPVQLWPTQEKAVAEVWEAADSGEPAVCLTAPTGGGKTVVMAALAAKARDRHWPTCIYTNRRILTDQAAATLSAAGIDHGVMAAGWDRSALANVQVCSFQTINSRVYGSGKWQLPRARLVLVDEAHSNKGDMATAIIKAHVAGGAFVCGVTATPIGVGHLYKRLIVGGTKAELRRLGKLVKCDVFAPDEPDLKGVRRVQTGEFEYKGQVKRLMETLVFGQVFDHWKKLNPAGEPTLLWAPGVEESRWFVQEWKKLGVSAGHIDAETTDDERRQLFADHKAGDLAVICSQGVLREGADLPWVTHGILCQPCNGLGTYLQIVGRLLRAYPGKERAILQDHAGAWHRHGSPNEDREWSLECSDESLAKERRDGFQKQGGEREPIRCPKCSGIRKAGPQCPHCGFKHTQSVRLVRMCDGELVPVRGRIHKQKRLVSDNQKAWMACLYACAYAKRSMTVEQAINWFKRKTGHEFSADLKPQPPEGVVNLTRVVTEVWPWLGKRRGAA